MDLTNRQLSILSLIIQEFLKTRQEVSSLQLKRNYDLKISSATLRNELVTLTEKGYLQKLHFASGRIPTLQAFKLFINQDLAITPAFPTQILTNLDDNIHEAVVTILAGIFPGLVFVVSKEKLQFKNLYNLVVLLINTLGPTESLSYTLEIIRFLEQHVYFYYYLSQNYGSSALKDIALISLDIPDKKTILPLLIMYVPFRHATDTGFIGTISIPDTQTLHNARILKELSHILTTV